MLPMNGVCQSETIGGFQVAIWFWDNVTEKLAAHCRLIVKYYPEFFANLPTLPIVERLLDKPLKVISISPELAFRQQVDDLLRLRGVSILDLEGRGCVSPYSRVNEDDPDGILCFCGMRMPEGST